MNFHPIFIRDLWKPPTWKQLKLYFKKKKKKQTVLHYNPENKIIFASIKRYWSEQESGHHDKIELQAAGEGKEETDFSIYLNT